MSRQRGLLFTVQALVWTLVLVILSGPVLALAQGWETEVGRYLVGSHNAAALMKMINFIDRPAGPEGDAIVRLAAQGVLRGDGNGYFNPEAAVTREQALVALVRLLDWGDLSQQAESPGRGGEAAVSAWAAGYLNVATDLGLLPESAGSRGGGGTDDFGDWTAAVSRQELAAWCVQALELSNGSAAKVGLFTLTAYADATDIRPELVETVKRALELGLLTPTEPNKLAPAEGVSRRELALILDRLGRLLPPGVNTAWEVARLESRIREQEEIAGLPALSELWVLTRPDGSKAVLKLSYDGNNKPLTEAVVVLKEGKLSHGDALKVGDSVRYLVQGERTFPYVPFLEVLPAGLVTISGQIEDMDLPTKRLTIRDSGQTRHELYLAPTAGITIGGQPASSWDLAPGLEATITVLDQMALQVTTDFINDAGRVDQPQLQLSGQVRTVDGRGLVLVLANGQTARYYLNSNTQVTVGGCISTIDSIQPGDMVQVHLSSPLSDWVERLVVAPVGSHYAELIRGRLGRFSPLGNKLVLIDSQRLTGGVWEQYAATMEVPLRPGAGLWYEDKEITIAQAAQLTGAEVYLAVSSGFGRQEALRALIWRGMETAYSGAIDGLNPGLGLVSLAQAELILSPGAIILKDGRLADSYGLLVGDSIQALARRASGESIGLVVSVVGQEKEHFVGYTVYRGFVDQVGQTAFTLSSYQTFLDGAWSSRRRRRIEDLGLSRDTVVLNLLVEEPARLSPDEFQQEFWQDYYNEAELLAVTEGYDVLGLALWPEGELDTARLSRGRVTAITTEMGPGTGQAGSRLRLQLTNTANFSPAKGTWEYASRSELGGLSAGQSLVIRDGRAYTGAVIAVGDDVVFLCRGQTVLLAWIKE
ncbi:MAG TPA: S-layer homology domain-containing protein [bacterium]|nr:S-layer homology domain-containing protein [bacterium]